MLDKIIQFSIKNKLLVGIFTVVLIVLGIYEVGKLPIDAVPDITDNQVQVITTSPALGAPDVERLITFPIEQANSNIPGLKEIRSISRFGLSVVTIVFNDGVNVYWARQQVTERLQTVQDQIPPGLGSPRLAPVTTGLGEIYQYTVRPKKGYEHKFDAMQLRTIQDWIVRRQLLGVKGIADVSSFGGYLKQYEVAVVPAQLKSYNLTISDVFNALEHNNQNTGGAYIEKGPTALYIRSEGLVTDTNDIKNIVVKNINGFPLLIRDIAEVRLGFATRYGAMTYNGEQEVAGAVVMMLKGANSNEVIKNIKERIDKIQKTLPEGVIIDPFIDRTKMVNHAIATVEQNLLEGALIVIFILVLFLGNIRAGLLVASVIPLSMLFAIIMMNIFHVSGNLMSLGALDFGLIVDGAVIIVEVIMHRLAQSRQYASVVLLSQKQMDEEVKVSASRMMNSAVFGQVIILIVYLPIFSLQGIEGKMFKPMAQTVAFALLGAFILSLTYIPMMSSLVLSKKLSHKDSLSDRFMHRVENAYSRTLANALNYKKVIIGTALGLFALAAILLTTLGGEFIPSLEEGDYAVETRVLTGSNLKTSVDAVSKASKILLSRYPEVIKVVGKTGSSEIPTDPMPLDASDMMVILKDKKHWTSAKTFPELAEKMTKDLQDVPGVRFGFQYPVQMRFNELMTGARQDVVCKIFGSNIDTLAHLARQLGAVASTVDGAKDLYVEAVIGMPQVVIKYDRAAIAQYGLNVAEINRIVNAAFAGQSTGQVFEDERRFDLVVRLAGNQRKDLQDVRNLLLPTHEGQQIPLYQVADVQLIEGPNQIQREDAQRRIIVGFNVRGRDVQSVVNELQHKVNSKIKLPTGYYTTYGGAFENLIAAKARLQIAVPVSLVLIFMMLYFAFGSLREGLLIYSAIPLSAVGGIFALVLRGMPFSISAGVGFIALFGVSVLNGIVLISEFNRLIKEGMTDIKEIVLAGTRNRIRPVLMTASVASLGFLPMALSNGAGAAVQRPLATVVIGGLLIATLLTLFVLPSLFLIFVGRKYKKATIPPAALILLLSMSVSPAFAQKPISLDEAIKMALKNNLEVKEEYLQVARDKRLTKTAYDLPKTDLTAEYGHVNSYFTDNKFGVAQAFSFPTVYKREKKLLIEEWKSSVLSKDVKEREIKRRVTEVFYELVFFEAKKKILVQYNDLYQQFLDKAKLRLEKGEAGVLERATAEIQLGQVTVQLQQLAEDMSIHQTKLSFLLRSDETYLPVSDSVKAALFLPTDTSVLNSHPQMKWLAQQLNIAAAQTNVQRSKLLPDLSVGYYNQSFVGYQYINGSDQYFDTHQRFSAAQAGIGIPVFSSAQRHTIAAARINEQMVQTQYEIGRQELTGQYLEAYSNYKKYTQAVHYYESSGLPNAAEIEKMANTQFIDGYINYLEWVVTMNQAISIHSDYIDAIRSLNQAVIQLNNFSN